MRVITETDRRQIQALVDGHAVAYATLFQATVATYLIATPKAR